MERLFSPHEKLAWFNLGILFLTLTVFVVLIPWLGFQRATGAFGLMALLAFGVIFGRRRRGSNEVISDERDQMIQSKSHLIAFRVSWAVFISACLIPYKLYQQQGSVPVELLPKILMIVFLVFVLTQSVATLVQYTQGRRNAHG